MKRIIYLLAALALIASACAVGVSAAAESKPTQMLVLGDSISTGYGLPYYDGTTPYECESYANMIARAYGFTAGDTYLNKAVNGDTSTDLLSLLPMLENYVKISDLIIVTIGGNDLLQSIPLVASAISGTNITTLEKAITVLQSATPDKFAALAQNADFQAKMGAVLAKYASNMTQIAAKLKELAPNSHIIFLKQYNPMKNVLGFADFGNFADTLIGAVNTTIDQVCAASGFDAVNVPSVIDVNAAGLTNILDFDIHPNAEGHAVIGEFLAEHLGVSLENTDSTEEEATEETTAQTTENVTEAVTDPVTDETTGEPEKTGCFASVSAASIIIACACAFVLTKKKN